MKLTLEESGWFNVMSHCWRLRQYGLFHTHRGLIAHTRAHGTRALLGLTTSKQSPECRDWDHKHSLFQRGHQELHRPFEMDLHCHRSSSSSATSHHLVPGSHCAARRTGESSRAREATSAGSAGKARKGGGKGEDKLHGSTEDKPCSRCRICAWPRRVAQVLWLVPLNMKRVKVALDTLMHHQREEKEAQRTWSGSHHTNMAAAAFLDELATAATNEQEQVLQSFNRRTSTQQAACASDERRSRERWQI